MILTTTRSLFKFPQIGSNSEEQLEIDLCKISIWKANIALKKMNGKDVLGKQAQIVEKYAEKRARAEWNRRSKASKEGHARIKRVSRRTVQSGI